MTSGKPVARSTGRTRSEQKAATRDRLLAAAAELFAEHEYGEVTIADIARRAGVAHGLLFHHFTNKPGIYRAVLDDVVEQMDAAFTVPDGADAPTAIRAALTTHLDYLAEHRAMALRLIAGRRSTDAVVRSVSDDGRDRALVAVAGLLSLDPSGTTAQFVGKTIVVAFDEATHLWLTGDNPVSIDALITFVIDVTIGALRGATALDPTLDVDDAVALLGAARTG